MRPLPAQGITLIKSFEGLEDGDPKTVNLDPYMDLSGYWTIGYGHLITYKGRALRYQVDRPLATGLYPRGLTKAEVDALFVADSIDKCRDVEHDVLVALNDNQFSALVSFTFNEGIGNLRSSTLLKLLNAGNYAAAALEFPKWDMSGGLHVPGLKRRRLAEQALFQS